MTEDLKAFKSLHLTGHLRGANKWFYGVAQVLIETDKRTSKNDKRLERKLDELSVVMRSYLSQADESIRNDCLFKIHTIKGLIKFYYFHTSSEKFDKDIKKQCLDLLLEAKKDAKIYQDITTSYTVEI